VTLPSAIMTPEPVIFAAPSLPQKTLKFPTIAKITAFVLGLASPMSVVSFGLLETSVVCFGVVEKSSAQDGDRNGPKLL
jgi:hypothetical protein